MNIIFAGTPEFAAVALEALLNSPHSIVAVYTQPDRPAGRGLKVTASPVKQLALMYQLPVHQPASLKDQYESQILSSFNADVMVVAAYSLLLPAAVLSIPRLGCINIHPSLLPRWRGAAPIQRTISAGDRITGISIMQMEQGLDSGPVLMQKQYVLDAYETSQSLHDKLAHMGGEAIVEALNALNAGLLVPHPQDHSQATYAHKISKEEALIDWMMPAQEIENAVRAFNPWPIAHTSWQGETVRIWNARALNEETNAAPRTIVKASQEGIDIATGGGILRLLQMQLPGGKVMLVKDFYNARQEGLQPGQTFI